MKPHSAFSTRRLHGWRARTRRYVARQCLPTLVALIMVGCGGDVSSSLFDEGSSSSASTSPVTEHVPVPDGVQCFDNFEKFKQKLGAAGEGKHWHHIVEKHDYNKKKFTERRLNCEDNLIAIAKDIHYQINGHYSKLRVGSPPETVRQWLRAQPWAEQRAYGLDLLRQHGIEP